jgi:hypothetical protein
LSVNGTTYAYGPVSYGGWEKARPYTNVLQDWKGWLGEGTVDTVTAMNYKRTDHAGGTPREYRLDGPAWTAGSRGVGTSADLAFLVQGTGLAAACQTRSPWPTRQQPARPSLRAGSPWGLTVSASPSVLWPDNPDSAMQTNLKDLASVIGTPEIGRVPRATRYPVILLWNKACHLRDLDPSAAGTVQG